jgi:predicted DNA-binding transcriptional regulator YafY
VNRIDRLTAILLLLQGKKRTAGEIAQHFEISRRTALRDIEALCEMGIPIATELGLLAATLYHQIIPCARSP